MFVLENKEADSVILECRRFPEGCKRESPSCVHLKSRTITVAAGTVVCYIFPSWRLPPDSIYTTFFISHVSLHFFFFFLFFFFFIAWPPLRDVARVRIARRCQCAREGSANVADGIFCVLSRVQFMQKTGLKIGPPFIQLHMVIGSACLLIS